MTETLILNTIFSEIQKRMLGEVFGTSKGRKAIHLEMTKQIFGKQMFAVLHRNSGT